MWKPQPIFLILVVIVCIFSAGCVQSPTGSAGTPTSPETTIPTPDPSMPVPTAVETSTPQEVVTIIRYVSLTRDIKASELLFALQVPAEWTVSTTRLTKSDTPDYRTDLVAGDVFSIYSYYFSPDKDRAYRDLFRQWSPAPTETMVTINGITYDRFESVSDSGTHVSYIVRRNCANERGYTNVLVFTARDSNPFEKEDFEKVVASFRYYGRDDIRTMPGEEIPLYDPLGNSISSDPGAGRSLAWGEWEGDSNGGDSSDESSGDDSSGDSSSGGSSSGGGSSGGCSFA